MDPAVRERVRAMIRPNIGTDAGAGGKLEEVNAVPRLGEIRVPTLAVLGDLDMAAILL